MPHKDPEVRKKFHQELYKKNKDKINDRSIQWRKDNRESYNERNKERMRRNRIREQGVILERDNWQCQMCGMNQEQSIVIFGKSLSIHHIDGQGSNLKKAERNDSMDNLETLCARCHTTKHMAERKEAKENKDGN